MKALPGQLIVVRRSSVWQEVVKWGGFTLIAIGVGVFTWTAVVLVFSLEKSL